MGTIEDAIQAFECGAEELRQHPSARLLPDAVDRVLMTARAISSSVASLAGEDFNGVEMQAMLQAHQQMGTLYLRALTFEVSRVLQRDFDLSTPRPPEQQKAVETLHKGWAEAQVALQGLMADLSCSAVACKVHGSHMNVRLFNLQEQLRDMSEAALTVLAAGGPPAPALASPSSRRVTWVERMAAAAAGEAKE
eukprot:Hpha_TRINITY_DN32547_c0_g1::TRINITY_DN32547_c0_g1_i1::g.24466::m.24466